jgi:CheY-like chemotaxis protein
VTLNREEMLVAFDHDARRHLRRLAAALTTLERAPTPAARQRALTRVVDVGHSLRGIAAITGLADLQRAAEALQQAAAGKGASTSELRPNEAQIRMLIQEARKEWRAAAVILHVDDDESSRRLLSVLLSQHPQIRLLSATSQREALELAHTHRPRLVLLDLTLGRERGEDVLRALKADPATRDTPVVIMSAEARPAQIERLLTAGAAGFMTKSVDIAAVLKLAVDSTATA